MGRRSRWWIVLWLALTLAIAFAVPRLPWRSMFTELTRAHPGLIALAVIANFLILPLWALEWRLLAPRDRPVPYRTMFDVVSITASVLNSIPFLAGEISAIGLLIGRAGLSRGAAFSVLALDQVLVAFAKLAVLVAAALLAPLPAWLRDGVLTLGVILSSALLALLPLAHRWHQLQGWLLRSPSRLRIALADLAAWGTHFGALRSSRTVAAVAALALLKKAAELAAVLAVQMAFGVPPSLSVGLLVLGALAISTMLPVAPANLGVYEATVFGVYRYVGLPADTALGLALVQHAAFLLPALFTGYALLTWRQMTARLLRA